LFAGLKREECGRSKITLYQNLPTLQQWALLWMSPDERGGWYWGLHK
jgi:hypothetical protein